MTMELNIIDQIFFLKKIMIYKYHINEKITEIINNLFFITRYFDIQYGYNILF